MAGGKGSSAESATVRSDGPGALSTTGGPEATSAPGGPQGPGAVPHAEGSILAHDGKGAVSSAVSRVVSGTDKGPGGVSTSDYAHADAQSGGVLAQTPFFVTLSDFPGGSDYGQNLREDLYRLANMVQEMRNEIGLPIVQTTETEDTAIGSAPKESLRDLTVELMKRINELEKQLTVCCEAIHKNDGVVQDQINSLQDQLEYLMKQAVENQEEGSKMCPELLKDLQELMQLFQTVQEMQVQLKDVHETALQLAAEKEDRKQYTHDLLEQIELLKVIKLDREDMIEAMADKVDLQMLARKVSLDQFEMACGDLSKGLEHAIGKLNVQESLWQQALDDIQREMEVKLDKIELLPVKEFFSKKLKQLQENLKQLSALRREVIAAGAKKKLLKDVNCISCDAQAVMVMEATAATTSKALPPSHSMKPYLTYELDSIRKSQACNVPQRNMRDWETIDKQMSHTKAPQKARPRSESDKHLCNRYCGGSHTVTTAAQRVARVGHFIKQWGPEVLPLSSGYAAGDDGKMYKVTVDTPATGGPGGAVEGTCTKGSSHEEMPKPPQKPIIISAECRCLEGDTRTK